MNHVKIKELATEVFENVKARSPNMSPDQMIDLFVLEYTKVVLFEATDVMRKSAADESPEVSKAMKVAVVDVLDHFGV